MLLCLCLFFFRLCYSQGTTGFIAKDEYISSFNKEKEKYNLPLLVWDSKLEALAKDRTKQCLGTPSNLDMRNMYKEKYDVDIGYIYAVAGASSIAPPPSIFIKPESWDCGATNGCEAAISGHCSFYRQLMWREATKFACAFATCPVGGRFLCLLHEYAFSSRHPFGSDVDLDKACEVGTSTPTSPSTPTPPPGSLDTLPRPKLGSRVDVTRPTFVKPINEERSRYGLDELRWAEKLATLAAETVVSCDYKIYDSSVLSTRYAQLNPGETASVGHTIALVDDAASISVDPWIKAKAQWNCKKDNCRDGSTCDPFRQLVTAGAVKIGCAAAQCEDVLSSTVEAAILYQCMFITAAPQDEHPFGDITKCPVKSTTNAAMANEPEMDMADEPSTVSEPKGPAPASLEAEESGGGLSGGAIAGIVVGTVVGVLLVIGLIAFALSGSNTESF